MRNEPFRVMIVGGGVVGRHHQKVIERHPRFDITALVDGDPASLEAFIADRETAGAPPACFADLESAVASREADVVVICTPSGLHAEQALTAASAGLHVLIEKPLDVTVAAAADLVDYARSRSGSGQVLAVVSQHRFDPASAAVKKLIEDGALGRVTSATATMGWYRSQEYYDKAGWRGTWRLDGGGAAMNQGVHTIDLLRWLVGRPRRISAYTALVGHGGIEVEDTAVAIVEFATGALATLHLTTSAFPGSPVRIQIHGTHGTAVIEDDRLASVHWSTDNSQEAVAAAKADDKAATLVPADELTSAGRHDDAYVRGHLRQYDDLARAIDTGTTPCVDVLDALESLALTRAIYRAAESGNSITFDSELEPLNAGSTR
ncbi:Gfo/Idh/MocA family protein [Jiangella endophytica]|uniref:Gfo/Idh/MocA family protein n=1 Tax=Jiangella endophytica TaxID=1623398 RepID=UPI000E34C3F5|nr:Gfo/Idh/MocA family oxidoreductase [Jiangella endophytica]